MSVYPERRSGRLTGKWIAEITQHGGRRRKRFDTRAEAERWADFTKAEGAPPSDARHDEPTAYPFGTVAKEAVLRHPGWDGHRDPSRQQRLMYAVDFLGADTPIASVTTADLDRLVLSLKGRTGMEGKALSPGTLNRYLAVVSAVLTYAQKRGYRTQAIVVPWQKEDGRRIHWLTDKQEQALSRAMLAEGRRDDELTLRVLTRTGLRWSEFATLTLGQIVGEWVKLDKTKTNTPRDVPIAPELGAELREMIERRGVPRYYTFRKSLKRALKSAGQSEEFSVHCLRHTTATRLVHGDVNLSVVKDFLGHSSLNTTLKYTHVSKRLLQEARQKISPHAGQSGASAAETANDNHQKTKQNHGGVEATPGIEPGCAVLQTAA